MPVISSTVLLFFALLASTAREDGIEAFQHGRYSIAREKLTEASKNPNDRQARLFLALTEAALGNCRKALPELIRPLSNEQSTLQRVAGLAAVKCYSATRDESKAFEALRGLEKRFPNDADVLYLSAKLHMKGFNDATLAMFQKAPASYRVHELSAEIFEVENRYGEAVSEYRKAIELNPQAPDLHFRLGRAILLEGHGPEQLKQAAAEFEAELKLSPEDAACEFQLGQIAQVQGKTEDAGARFERAVELSPDFVQGLLALGKLRIKAERYPEAIQLLSRAAALQPASETAHYALLTAYRNSGQMQKAQSEKAILDRLQKPPEGEFTEFLKKLDKPKPQPQ
jgi:tetratricopeptide (TPR) repeat protein